MGLVKRWKIQMAVDLNSGSWMQKSSDSTRDSMMCRFGPQSILGMFLLSGNFHL